MTLTAMKTRPSRKHRTGGSSSIILRWRHLWKSLLLGPYVKASSSLSGYPGSALWNPTRSSSDFVTARTSERTISKTLRLISSARSWPRSSPRCRQGLPANRETRWNGSRSGSSLSDRFVTSWSWGRTFAFAGISRNSTGTSLGSIL